MMFCAFIDIFKPNLYLWTVHVFKKSMSGTETYSSIFNQFVEHNYCFTLLFPNHLPEVWHCHFKWTLKSKWSFWRLSFQMGFMLVMYMYIYAYMYVCALDWIIFCLILNLRIFHSHEHQHCQWRVAKFRLVLGKSRHWEGKAPLHPLFTTCIVC